jgi:hypothetical protein
MKNRPFRFALAVFVLLLITWPLTFRYTSVGIDTEHADGATVRERFWRVRWPGDGSVMVGWVDQHRSPDKHALEPFDLGGTFLQPSKAIPPESIWNRLGFWYVHRLKGRDGAWLVGVPHWGLIVLSGLTLVWRRWGPWQHIPVTPQ